MDIKEIESILKKTSDGDFSVRLDEGAVETALKPVAQMLNRTLEKAAAAKELKHRADVMIQYNPMAISILGRDRRRIHINKAYETVWRGSREELLKKSLEDFDVTVLSGEPVYACFQTKKLAISECLVRFPDGIKKYLTLNAIPILDKKGDVDGAFYVWMDYTELHDKMDAVKKTEQRVDRIIQENPFPLFTIDLELNVKLSNQAFLKLSGYSQERVFSLSMKDFKYLKNKGETVERTIKSKKRSQGESTIEFPSGTCILEWYYIPLPNAEGNVENLLVVLNDITERRQKEKEVRQTGGGIAEKSRSAFDKRRSAGKRARTYLTGRSYLPCPGYRGRSLNQTEEGLQRFRGFSKKGHRGTGKINTTDRGSYPGYRPGHN